MTVAGAFSESGIKADRAHVAAADPTEVTVAAVTAAAAAVTAAAVAVTAAAAAVAAAAAAVAASPPPTTPAISSLCGPPGAWPYTFPCWAAARRAAPPKSALAKSARDRAATSIGSSTNPSERWSRSLVT